jgi:hypothetical protein
MNKEFEKLLNEFKNEIILEERDRIQGIINDARDKFVGLDEALEAIYWIEKKIDEEMCLDLCK